MYNDSLSFISQFAGKSIFMQISIFFYSFFEKFLAACRQTGKMAGKQARKIAGNRMWYIMKKGGTLWCRRKLFLHGKSGRKPQQDQNRSIVNRDSVQSGEKSPPQGGICPASRILPQASPRQFSILVSCEKGFQKLFGIE